MRTNCEWLHNELEHLPLYGYPIDFNKLPENGIYFFYETGEIWGHGSEKLRIVRVGTHKDGNFKSRIKDHYLINERKLNFNSMQPAPKDRSIFRKNIGRALLNKNNFDYLKIWEIDFTYKHTRAEFGHLRNIEFERKIEMQINEILRNNFSFRFIELDNEDERMGGEGLESYLIGTLSECSLCRPSTNWLGNYSSKDNIRNSGLWLTQHLKHCGLTDSHKKKITELVERSTRIE